MKQPDVGGTVEGAWTMRSLREWCTSYRHEDGDLIELFYNPALTCAVQYDRMTGYFSADALALAARGIATREASFYNRFGQHIPK